MANKITLSKGDIVFVPASVWPSEKPPKGKKGWEGVIIKENDKESWVVAFKGDPTKYFFKKSDIEKWTKMGPGAAAIKTPGGDAGPSNPATSPSKKRPRPAGKTTTPRTGTTKEDDAKAEKLIQEIETLLPLIDLPGLKSIAIDIRRMAGN